MANTLIQLKHSTVTDIPPSLNTAEPAYSFTSNTLFIGLNGAVINIGGYHYTSQIDSATDSATGSTLVKRDASGNASFNFITANIVGTIAGNASTASKWLTARDLGLAGDATGNVSIDGSQNVTLTLELTNTGVTPGTYGGSTNIPVITVDEDGRVTSASNTSISTDLNIKADTGSNVISLATDTLTFVGGDGITTSVGPTDNVAFAVDNTVIRTTGDQTITGNLNITGNVYVSGNLKTIDVETLNITDPLIYLAANNYTSDLVDIGFAGNYFDGSTNRHVGVVRKAGTNEFYIFTGYDAEFDTNVLNIANPSLVIANTHTNVKDGTLYNVTINSLASALDVKDGGTGQVSFTTGGLLIGNGTGDILQLANTSSAGTYGNSAFVPVVTVDDYGRVSSVTTQEIKISMNDLDGILPVNNGGLGANTFSSGQQIVFNGSSFESLANVATTGSGTLATSNTITSVTTDDYGRLTAFVATPIAIGASQITSGTLGVNRGGTGANTFTTNGVLLGQGTSAITTVSSSTEGHILTINNSGVPQFQMLSGGTF